jgi:hypothetical protein
MPTISAYFFLMARWCLLLAPVLFVPAIALPQDA